MLPPTISLICDTGVITHPFARLIQSYAAGINLSISDMFISVHFLSGGILVGFPGTAAASTAGSRVIVSLYVPRDPSRHRPTA